MTASQSIKFGFKRLSLENWLRVDPVWDGSEPAKKSGQNIPKNRCRTTISERMGETPAELPFIRDQVVCLSHDQAAPSGAEQRCGGLRLQPAATVVEIGCGTGLNFRLLHFRRRR
jgi:hypothetical protein